MKRQGFAALAAQKAVLYQAAFLLCPALNGRVCIVFEGLNTPKVLKGFW